ARLVLDGCRSSASAAAHQTKTPIFGRSRRVLQDRDLVEDRADNAAGTAITIAHYSARDGFDRTAKLKQQRQKDSGIAGGNIGCRRQLAVLNKALSRSAI